MRTPVVIDAPAVRAVLAALAIASAYAARSAAGYGAVSPHPAAALVLWATSIGLAAGAFRAPYAALPASPAHHRWSAADGAIAFLILVLALLLRAHTLGERPVLGGDEAGWGVFARGIVSGGGNPLGFGWYDWPALGAYVTALSLWVQGSTVEALRVPSAVAGSLTAMLVYFYGARLAGRFGGAVAGLVAASLVLHVHLSRQGLQNVFDGLSAVVVLASLERGWVEKRRSAFLVAGAALAVSQHFYASARVLPLIAAAWIALRFVQEGRRAAERWRDLAAMAFVAAVASWPQITLALEQPARWLAPMTRQAHALPSMGDAGAPLAWASAMLALVRDASLAFVAIDMRGMFTPAAPLLPPLAGVAFVAGLVDLARRWREPSSQMLALWIASVVAISALSESTPAGHRYLMVVPAAALVAGLGSATIVRAARGRGPRTGAAAAVVVIAALVAEGAVRSEHYFRRMPTWVGTSRDVHSDIALDLAARIASAPPGSTVVMLGAPRMWYRGFHHLRFLQPATVGRDVEADEDAGAAVASGCRAQARKPRATTDATVDCLVAVLPHREDALETIRSAVTVVRETAVSAADGVPLYRLVEACGACGAPSEGAAGGTAPAVSSTR